MGKGHRVDTVLYSLYDTTVIIKCTSASLELAMFDWNEGSFLLKSHFTGQTDKRSHFFSSDKEVSDFPCDSWTYYP